MYADDGSSFIPVPFSSLSLYGEYVVRSFLLDDGVERKIRTRLYLVKHTPVRGGNCQNVYVGSASCDHGLDF